MSYNNYDRNKKHFNSASKGGELQSRDPKLDHEPVQAKPLEVRVYNDNFERALRAFRALVQKERILSLYKEKQFYEKPSDKKRRKKNESKRKTQELDSDRKNNGKYYEQ